MTVELGREAERLTSVRVAGPVAGLARPFGNGTAVWAALCGAVVGSQGAPVGADLLPLLYTALLVSLGWAAGWRLVTETDWFGPMRDGWPPRHPARLPAPPYTQPGSPAGRLWRGVNGLVGWWREVFWPAVGGALAALAAAGVLAVVFSLLLVQTGALAGEDVRRLGAAFLALAALGLAWRRHGRDWPAGRAAVLVALPWLAGLKVMIGPGPAGPAAGPVLLAAAFTLAAWGAERLARGLWAGGWLLATAQAAVVALLVLVGQPLAAGAAGALLLMQLARLPAAGASPARAAAQARLWLLATMLVAALGLR